MPNPHDPFAQSEDWEERDRMVAAVLTSGLLAAQSHAGVEEAISLFIAVLDRLPPRKR